MHANALHPGVILTDLSRHLQPEDYEHLRRRAPGGRMRMKSVAAGAATSVWAATAPELEGRGGLYLEDCGVAAVDDSEGAAGGVRSYAVDPDAARRLWSVSEELVGERFALSSGARSRLAVQQRVDARRRPASGVSPLTRTIAGNVTGVACRGERPPDPPTATTRLGRWV